MYNPDDEHRIQHLVDNVLLGYVPDYKVSEEYYNRIRDYFIKNNDIDRFNKWIEKHRFSKNLKHLNC